MITPPHTHTPSKHMPRDQDTHTCHLTPPVCTRYHLYLLLAESSVSVCHQRLSPSPQRRPKRQHAHTKPLLEILSLEDHFCHASTSPTCETHDSGNIDVPHSTRVSMMFEPEAPAKSATPAVRCSCCFAGYCSGWWVRTSCKTQGQMIVCTQSCLFLEWSSCGYFVRNTTVLFPLVKKSWI